MEGLLIWHNIKTTFNPYISMMYPFPTLTQTGRRLAMFPFRLIKGKIVQVGTYNDLAAADGKFRELLQMQKKWHMHSGVENGKEP